MQSINAWILLYCSFKSRARRYSYFQIMSKKLMNRCYWHFSWYWILLTFLLPYFYPFSIFSSELKKKGISLRLKDRFFSVYLLIIILIWSHENISWRYSIIKNVMKKKDKAINFVSPYLDKRASKLLKHWRKTSIIDQFIEISLIFQISAKL